VGRGGLWPVASGSGGAVGLDARGADMAWTARQWAAAARGGRATVEAEPGDMTRRASAGGGYAVKTTNEEYTRASVTR
jgi:hypothetical protein